MQYHLIPYRDLCAAQTFLCFTMYMLIVYLQLHQHHRQHHQLSRHHTHTQIYTSDRRHKHSRREHAVGFANNKYDINFVHKDDYTNSSPTPSHHRMEYIYVCLCARCVSYFARPVVGWLVGSDYYHFTYNNDRDCARFAYNLHNHGANPKASVSCSFSYYYTGLHIRMY